MVNKLEVNNKDNGKNEVKYLSNFFMPLKNPTRKDYLISNSEKIVNIL